MKSAALRVGGDGYLMLAVVFQGTLQFENGPSGVSLGGLSMLVMRSSSSGTPIWSLQFNGQTPTSGFTMGSMDVSANGTLILTAGYYGSVNLPTTNDTFVAAYNANMSQRWLKTVSVGSTGSLVAAAGPCALVLATNSTTVDFGSGPLSTQTAPNAASIGVAAIAY
jgi:hypothetical protein